MKAVQSIEVYFPWYGLRGSLTFGPAAKVAQIISGVNMLDSETHARDSIFPLDLSMDGCFPAISLSLAIALMPVSTYWFPVPGPNPKR